MSSKRKPLGARQVGRNIIIILDGTKCTKKTEDNKEVEAIKRKIEIYNKAVTDAQAEEAMKALREIFMPISEKNAEVATMESKGIKQSIKKTQKAEEAEKKKILKALREKSEKLIKLVAANAKKFKYNDLSYLFTVNDEGKLSIKSVSSISMPELLINRIEEFITAGKDVTPLINFWHLCLLNPNPTARHKLFDYLERNGLTITPSGYFVTYRMVKRTEEIGVFTDAHTHTMRYLPQTICRIPREECDEDGSRDCSKGLHTGTPRFIGIVAEKKLQNKEAVGALGDGYGIKRVVTKEEVPDSYGTGYNNPTKTVDRVQNFDQQFGNQAIITLINPQHVVSIPDSDTRKMRSCEFYFCKLTTPEEVIDMVENDYLLFDDDYQKVELAELQEMLKDTDVKKYVDTKPSAKKSKKVLELELSLEKKRKEIKIGGDKINSELDVETLKNIIQQRLIVVTPTKGKKK